jgi:hypothetical protein
MAVSVGRFERAFTPSKMIQNRSVVRASILSLTVEVALKIPGVSLRRDQVPEL